MDAKGAVEEAPSDEEMDGINNIVGDTKIVRFLESQARTHSDKIDKLRIHLDDQVKGLHNHLKSMLEQVRRDGRGAKRAERTHAVSCIVSSGPQETLLIFNYEY